MARHRENNPGPAWFNLAAYAAAREMDAADWYLNLSLRRHVRRTNDDFWTKYVRSNPLLRRHDGVHLAFFAADTELGSDFMAILEDTKPQSGVRPLRGDELYFFEKKLPDHVRAFGATFVAGETSLEGAPEGFSGPLDQLYERRFASSFLRVDITRPDHVLIEDMREFLRIKRAELAAIEGVHPYRAALAEIENRNDPKLSVWAMRKLLAVIDVDQWRQANKSKFTDAEIQRLLDIAENDFRQARKDAEQLLTPFALDAWLLPLARKAMAVGTQDFA